MILVSGEALIDLFIGIATDMGFPAEAVTRATFTSSGTAPSGASQAAIGLIIDTAAGGLN